MSAARGREQGPSPPSLARLGPRTAKACVEALTMLAVPSSQRERAGPLSAGSHPVRAAHRLCVCRGHSAVDYAEQREGGGKTAGSRLAWTVHRLCACCGPDTVGCAEQREGERRVPPRRVSPDPGHAPPMRVSWSWSCLMCRAATLRGQGPSPPGLAGSGRAQRLCLCSGPYTVGCAAQRKGESRVPPAGSRPARAAHHLSGCHDHDAVSCAEQQDGGGKAPPRQI